MCDEQELFVPSQLSFCATTRLSERSGAARDLRTRRRPLPSCDANRERSGRGDEYMERAVAVVTRVTCNVALQARNPLPLF